MSNCAYRHGFLSLCLFATLTSLVPRVEAAFGSVTADAYDVNGGGSNSDFHEGFATVSASFTNPQGGGAMAFATLDTTPSGGLIMKASAEATAGELVSNSAIAAVRWDDRIRIAGTPSDVLIDMEFEFNGSASGEAGVTGSISGCIDFLCRFPELTDPGTVRFEAVDSLSPSKYMSLSVVMIVRAAGIDVDPTNSTADSADYSLRLVSITPYDANGNIVRGISVVSDAGFDYNPLLIYNVVPEPSSLALCSITAASVVSTRKRANCRS